jgi:hypothetical protein
VNLRHTTQRAVRRHDRAAKIAQQYDGYLSKLQLADRHEGPTPALARFWLQEPGSSIYCAEVVTLRCGGLLVHGDVDTVCFSRCSYKHWRQVVSWMGNHNYTYAEEKASIGGTKDARVYEPSVALADVLYYRRHKILDADQAFELWENADEDGPQDFARRVYDLTGDCELPGSIGWCTGSRVLMAQAALRRLLALLGPEEDTP